MLMCKFGPSAGKEERGGCHGLLTNLPNLESSRPMRQPVLNKQERKNSKE